MATRRTFIKQSLMTLGSISVAPYVHGRSKTRVVIVGGGVAGITVAKELLATGNAYDITLIERNASYHTCFMSNEVISGARSIESIRFDYSALKRPQLTTVFDEVVAIDPVNKSVTTASSGGFMYDRCVVSPGIDFDTSNVEGYNETSAQSMPHAWRAGEQTLLLRRQLTSMADGGRVLIIPPKGKYRCPAAPYERASLIAEYLKNSKPKSSIHILDPKVEFPKDDAVLEGWRSLYGYESEQSMIEWSTGEENTVVEIDEETNTVITDFGDEYTADVVNFIPQQRAGQIAFLADLVAANGWCPVYPLSFESKKYPEIHVVGDASDAGVLPKSAYAATTSAIVCAQAIDAMLHGKPLQSNPRFSNSCFTMLGEQRAVSIFASYHVSDDGLDVSMDKPTPNAEGSDTDVAQQNLHYQRANKWFEDITTDLFSS